MGGELYDIYARLAKVLPCVPACSLPSRAVQHTGQSLRYYAAVAVWIVHVHCAPYSDFDHNLNSLKTSRLLHHASAHGAPSNAIECFLCCVLHVCEKHTIPTLKLKFI